MSKSRNLAIAAVVALVAALSVAPGASAGSRTHAATGAGSCTVSGNVVTATGLPTDAVLNFMVSDASGTSGWVLGWGSDGTWSLTVPDRTGPTTYEFASTTFGKDGRKYWVYASCSAS